VDLIEKLLLFFVESFVVVVCDTYAFLEPLIVGTETDQLLAFIFQRNAHLLLDNVLDAIDVVFGIVKSCFVLVSCLKKDKFKQKFWRKFQASLGRNLPSLRLDKDGSFLQVLLRDL
jgi:hypothetical protein